MIVRTPMRVPGLGGCAREGLDGQPLSTARLREAFELFSYWEGSRSAVVRHRSVADGRFAAACGQRRRRGGAFDHDSVAREELSAGAGPCDGGAACGAEGCSRFGAARYGVERVT